MNLRDVDFGVQKVSGITDKIILGETEELFASGKNAVKPLMDAILFHNLWAMDRRLGEDLETMEAHKTISKRAREIINTILDSLDPLECWKTLVNIYFFAISPFSFDLPRFSLKLITVKNLAQKISVDDLADTVTSLLLANHADGFRSRVLNFIDEILKEKVGTPYLLQAKLSLFAKLLGSEEPQIKSFAETELTKLLFTVPLVDRITMLAEIIRCGRMEFARRNAQSFAVRGQWEETRDAFEKAMSRELEETGSCEYTAKACAKLYRFCFSIKEGVFEIVVNHSLLPLEKLVLTDFYTLALQFVKSGEVDKTGEVFGYFVYNVKDMSRSDFMRITNSYLASCKPYLGVREFELMKQYAIFGYQKVFAAENAKKGIVQLGDGVLSCGIPRPPRQESFRLERKAFA